MRNPFLPSRLRAAVLPLGLTALAVTGLTFSAFADSEIGAQAREAASTRPHEAAGVTAETIGSLLGFIKILGALVVLLTIVAVNRAIRLVDFDPFRNIKATPINAAMLLAGIFIGGFLVVYEFVTDSGKILPPSASEHGASIDRIFFITFLITALVFVVTHLLLFGFAWTYRSKPGAKAIFYHDNHKLELIWTALPAVALTVMVLFGIRAWNEFHNQDTTNALKVEFIAEQFKWNIRYAGKDGKLGKYNFRLAGNNAFGADSTDPDVQDDVMPTVKELHVPVGRTVEVAIKSKDVLHGFYAPHFRNNIYAVPGMPTHQVFKPTITTAEMRKKVNNPNFNFEVACSQLCGASHWNMRVVVVVETQEEYQKWLDSQPTFNPAKAPAQKIAAAN